MKNKKGFIECRINKYRVFLKIFLSVIFHVLTGTNTNQYPRSFRPRVYVELKRVRYIFSTEKRCLLSSILSAEVFFSLAWLCSYARSSRRIDSQTFFLSTRRLRCKLRRERSYQNICPDDTPSSPDD